MKARPRGSYERQLLEQACREAVEKNQPFTHVHLLAHGYPVEFAHKEHFGVALYKPNGELDVVMPERLGKALAALIGHTVVVTLATCDAGNRANTITSNRSIAHVLHESGFPIVIASQFPFTVPGSNLMVETFYKALALHKTRVALYKSREQAGHDWASLVGYARLTEGYADHLLDVRLECVLAALKTMQGWSDELVKRGDRDPLRFDQVATQLRARIEALEGFSKEPKNAGRRGVLDENVGLLGSAEKRLAELCFARARLRDAAHWHQLMRAALERSRDWYRKGSESNLSHHWTAVQSLSLNAVLDGRIADPGRAYAAVTAARIDKGNTKQNTVIWALGSLIEIYLLAPLAGQSPPADAARNALAERKALVRQQPGGDTFPLESTERQLRRYVEWWTTANGFFPGTSDDPPAIHTYRSGTEAATG
ncbi:MAG: CHAT domain-containing protein [Gammaproteobacteria bacterium]